MDYHALNAMLNLYDADGKIQFEKDVQAAREYFLQHVNQNTVFFHNQDEKLDYLVQKEYYEREVLDQYSRNFVKELLDRAYADVFTGAAGGQMTTRVTGVASVASAQPEPRRV